ASTDLHDLVVPVRVREGGDLRRDGPRDLGVAELIHVLHLCALLTPHPALVGCSARPMATPPCTRSVSPTRTGATSSTAICARLPAASSHSASSPSSATTRTGMPASVQTTQPS